VLEMAKIGNRNYARGRAREEELARILREAGLEVERSPLSGQSARHRKDGAGWDLRVVNARNPDISYTVSVKTGKSVPIGIWRVNSTSSILASSIQDCGIGYGLFWRADVSRDTICKMRGTTDILAVKRPGAKFGWVWVFEVDDVPRLWKLVAKV
jgi:hypothetical protein